MTGNQLSIKLVAGITVLNLAFGISFAPKTSEAVSFVRQNANMASNTLPAGTPILVQHVSFSSNQGNIITHYGAPLPRAVLPGNAIIVAIQNAAGGVPSSVTDDQSNTYTQGVTAVSAGSGQQVFIYYTLNATNSPRVIQVAYDGDGVANTALSISEFANIASIDAVDGTSAGVATSNTVATGAITTTADGDLIFQYAVQDSEAQSGVGTKSMGSWNVGDGYTLLSSDIWDNQAAQFMVQTTHGPVTPAMTMTPRGADDSNENVTVAMAFKSASAGTEPAPGAIGILRLQHQDLPVGATTSTVEVQFPTQGSMAVAAFASEPSADIISIIDNTGDIWTHTGTVQDGSSQADLWYDANPTVSSSRILQVTYALTINGGETIFLYDLKNAAFDKRGTATGNQTVQGPFAAASVTPSTSNGLIISICAVESNTVILSNHSFVAAITSGENSPWPVDQNNGYKVYFNPDTSTVTDEFIADGPVAGWADIAAAFKPTATDTTPPAAPADLTAVPISSSQISLSWTASTDVDSPVAAYNIYRNGALIGTTATASFQDGGLAAATTYSYAVSAYDPAGNVSGQSLAVSATTLQDTIPPSVPAGLRAAAVSSSQINLSWTASTDVGGAVAGYNLYRNGTVVATTAGTSYQDTGLSLSTTYSYAVSAYDTAVNVSLQSSPVSATTLGDTTSPSVPTGLAATPVSISQINLSWTASTDPDSPVAGYNIYRNSVQIRSSITTSYSDTGLTPLTAYSYTVTAYDASGNESGQSTAASAITQAVVSVQIRQEYAIGYAENIAADTEGFIHLDTDALDGSVSYYFEVTQLNLSTATVTLRRNGTTIDDASITLDGVANHVQRSNAFTPPVGATDYVFDDPDVDEGDYMVRIVALQSNFTKTQTQIELNTDGNSTNPYSSTTFDIAFPHPAYWKYTAANCNGTKTFSWEIVWKTSSSSATATAQLQTSSDGSSWSAVGSDVTTTSTTATRTRTTFTPTDGNFYRIVVRSSSDADSVTAFAYRIIVDQTDSPTKLEANYVIANRWSTSSSNNAATKWVQADWSGTTNIYEHRNVTENASTTDVIQLYGITDAANLTGSTNAADGTIMVTSGPVTMPATDQDIGYNYAASIDSTFVDSRILVLVSIP